MKQTVAKTISASDKQFRKYCNAMEISKSVEKIVDKKPPRIHNCLLIWKRNFLKP